MHVVTINFFQRERCSINCNIFTVFLDKRMKHRNYNYLDKMSNYVFVTYVQYFILVFRLKQLS